MCMLHQLINLCSFFNLGFQNFSIEIWKTSKILFLLVFKTDIRNTYILSVSAVRYFQC